jgi:hypothetical protein
LHAKRSTVKEEWGKNDEKVFKKFIFELVSGILRGSLLVMHMWFWADAIG